MNNKKRIKSVSIGADPELLIINEHSDIIEAQGILPFRGQVGSDGAGTPAELRPRPTTNAINLTKNINKLLIKLKKKLYTKDIKNIRLICGSGYDSYDNGFVPIGGHIHFGFKNINDDLRYCLHSISVLINKKENKEIRMKRIYEDYGIINFEDDGDEDIRKKRHGFEYRVPHSWLTTPQYTSAVLALYHAVLLEFKNYGLTKELNNMKKIILAKNIFDKYNNGKRISDNILKEIANNVLALNVIKNNRYNYKTIIKPFLNSILVSEKNKILFIDEKSWKLNDIKFKPIKNLIFSFNRNDDYLMDIKGYVKKFKKYKVQPINIIGLKNKRKYDIYLSKDLGHFSKDIKNKYNLKTNSNDKDLNYHFSKKTIGFSFNLRETNQNLIIKILNEIGEKICAE